MRGHVQGVRAGLDRPWVLEVLPPPPLTTTTAAAAAAIISTTC